jgi:hypothetical protein
VKARGGTNTTCWLQAWQTKETAELSTIGGQQFMFICRRLKCKKIAGRRVFSVRPVRSQETFGPKSIPGVDEKG